ncbi:MAG: TonB family protein [Ignavibacteriales bacterium]|nr:TonB family protein [Ignavibacteriales bacterium]
MKTAALLLAVILSGCSAKEQVFRQDRLPQLILQDPLPPLAFAPGNNLRIDLRILIDEGGNVAHVELVRPAVNPKWDSLARQTIYRWKFSPATSNGKPVRVWMRFPAVVQFAEPRFMELAEIVCESRITADSIFALLHSGAHFDEMAMRHSVSESARQAGRLGKVNIRRYPDEVQRILTEMGDGAFTSPVHLGNSFIIFKRLPPQL